MEKILQQILEQVTNINTEISEIKTDISTLKAEVTDIKASQVRMETKLDVVFDQTANLTEYHTEVTDKLNQIGTDVKNIGIELNVLEDVTAKNCFEIARLKVIK